jgi:hypothetical protein
LLSDPNIAVDGVAPGIFFSKFGNKGGKIMNILLYFLLQFLTI